MKKDRKTAAKKAAKIGTNFWQTLPRPLFVLAPMANVTDSVFRKLFAKYGKPHVTWTEFVSADGLMSPGRDRLLVDLVYSRAERPIVAQLFTGHPEAMRGAAKLVAELGYDGLDINMGCPDRAVEKQGGGAANIRNPKNALAVIEAAREGVAGQLPVSVKTRIGYNKVEMDWLRLLLQFGLAEGKPLPVLTVHLRTRKEMSDVPAHWELMPEIVKLRDEVQAALPANERTLIVGNGDVMSLDEAREKTVQSGCDGIMIGRGIFGKPWFFEGLTRQNPAERTPEERLAIMLEHTKLFEKTFCGTQATRGHKSFAVMKKHFKAYVNGWDGAKELRAKLMETNSAKEVATIVREHVQERAVAGSNR